MKPRDLGSIVNLPNVERYEVLAEGLALLAEHVTTLRSDLLHLRNHRSRRGAEVIDGVASEEAAKILILLDIARMGFDHSNQKAVNAHLKHFYDHLVRGIYIELAEGSPKHFGETREYIELLRRDLYLDGPNDVDWIFRNEIEAKREERIYVDYVTHEEGSTWTSPAKWDEVSYSRPPSQVIDLALALHRKGCTSKQGLETITREWRGFTLKDGTRWAEVRDINQRIYQTLERAGLSAADVSPQEDQLLLRQWTFPLGGVDLKRIKVERDDLKKQRDAWTSQQ